MLSAIVEWAAKAPLPLAVMVVGALLVVIGAAGGIQKISLSIPELGWRIALAVMGAVVAGLGVILIWRRGRDVQASPEEIKDYELKIAFPTREQEVGERIRMSGTYKRKPPTGSVVILDQSLADGRYWFKRSLVDFEEPNRWSADLHIAGQPPTHRKICIAVAGPAGKALLEYYFTVTKETEKYVGVSTLTPDIAVCDSVVVWRK
jgi:hypothetical protein